MLEIYDMGSLIVAGGDASPKRTSTVTGCMNATRIDYGRGPARDTLALACRGDRAVLLMENGGADVRRLEDSRLVDVVGVAMGDSRGAHVVSVADFGSGQVLSYLDGPIDTWGDAVFGGLGADGKAKFEFTGAWKSGGSPFVISAAQIP